MATKEDIIWFSDFLKQYDLGIKLSSTWNSKICRNQVCLYVNNVEHSTDPLTILKNTPQSGLNRFEISVMLEIKQWGRLFVSTATNVQHQTRLREQILFLPEAISFKELKMKIELKGTVEYKYTEIPIMQLKNTKTTGEKVNQN